MEVNSADVVVVGGGPVGLFLASELALYGVRAMVLERRVEPDYAPKAGGIGALAAEALERRGLGPALDAGLKQVLTEIQQFRATLPANSDSRSAGGHFAGLSVLDPKFLTEPTRRMRGIHQHALERILWEHAQSLGVQLLRGCQLESFEDSGGRVKIAVSSNGEARTFEAAFLVGCDGGRSTVRKRGGFDFPGTDPTVTGHQAMAELDHPERLLPLGWRHTATGMMGYGPVAGRVAVIEFEGPPADRDSPVSREEMEASLRRVSGADVRIKKLDSATRFTDNARQATTYQRGRVFLAGDAAHVHSPFGGQGLTLGILDAGNLGWKLAATIRGWAPEGLLETYTSERWPVAAGVLANTRAQLALMRPDVQTSALRDLFSELLRSEPGANRFIGELMSGVNTRYDLGGSGGPLVGKLIANAPLTIDGAVTSVYALMRDGRGLLLLDDAAPAFAFETPQQLRIVRASGAKPMLIRPDGCVAWAGEEGLLRPALQRWFAV